MISLFRSPFFMALGVAVLGLWGFQGSATEFNHTTNLIDEMGPAPEMPQ